MKHQFLYLFCIAAVTALMIAMTGHPLTTDVLIILSATFIVGEIAELRKASK
jgi:hypothetical protein